MSKMESKSDIALRILKSQGVNAARGYLGYPPMAPEGRIIREGGKEPPVDISKAKPLFTKREWTGLKYVMIGCLLVFGMIGVPEGIMSGQSPTSILTGWLSVSIGMTGFWAFVLYATNKTFEVKDE